MKTIILCGGKGTRLHEETEFKPKPMVLIGREPILLHIMRIYAQYNFKEFVLCLGYKGHLIREYFLHLPTYANDLELNLADNSINFLNDTVKLDYKISFIETGLEAPSGDRVKQAAQYISDPEFMVTYGDGVGNINLLALLTHHRRQNRRHGTLATLTATHPSSKYGQLLADRRGIIRDFAEKPKLHDYVNGGFMVFTQKALRYLRPGDTLEQGLERLTKAGKLSQYKHEGFWHGMDTMKDVLYLNDIWHTQHPWLP